MWLTTRADVQRKPTMERPAERCEEEGTLNNETTDGLIGFPTENYLAKQRDERTTLCMQVYIVVWALAGSYAVWSMFTSFP